MKPSEQVDSEIEWDAQNAYDNVRRIEASRLGVFKKRSAAERERIPIRRDAYGPRLEHELSPNRELENAVGLENVPWPAGFRPKPRCHSVNLIEVADAVRSEHGWPKREQRC
jgi:hypothetical protein